MMRIAQWIFLLLIIGCISCANLQHAITIKPGEAGIDLLALRQPRGKTCASTCLYTVSRYLRIDKTMKEIQAELGPLPKRGYTLKQLRDWARKNELHAFVIRGSMEELKSHVNAGRPVIVVYRARWGKNHSVVVRGISMDGEINVMDPKKGGYVKMGETDFMSKWGALGNPMLIIARKADSG